MAPCAFAAVRDITGRMLLVRRCDTGDWELPGGHVDPGESAADAAVRETAGETGLTVQVTGLAGIYTDPGHVIADPRTGLVRQPFDKIRPVAQVLLHLIGVELSTAARCLTGAVKPFREAYHGRGAFASRSRPPLTTRYVPFARSLSSYSRTRLRTDVIAGVTVAALALPSAMAYAELAVEVAGVFPQQRERVVI